MQKPAKRFMETQSSRNKKIRRSVEIRERVDQKNKMIEQKGKKSGRERARQSYGF